MCFGKSRYRYWEERVEGETRDQRLWDLFHRETERSDRPLPVAEQDDEDVAEHDRDEVPVGAGR
jgi:hypothetical protein